MLAMNVAQSFKELKGVINKILVTESTTPATSETGSTPPIAKATTSPMPIQRLDPSKLELEIYKALRNAGFPSITVEVRDNLEVTLKGSVSSMEEKIKLLRLIKGIKGVREIKDMVFVIE
jgi:osmotically-inducible protein OsmY